MANHGPVAGTHATNGSIELAISPGDTRLRAPATEPRSVHRIAAKLAVEAPEHVLIEATGEANVQLALALAVHELPVLLAEPAAVWRAFERAAVSCKENGRAEQLAAAARTIEPDGGVFNADALRRWAARWKPGVVMRPDNKCTNIISHAYRFIWAGIPKVATRSFRSLLITDPPLEFRAEETTRPIAELKTVTGLRDYVCFAFVRNPWARVVSCYRSKIENPGPAEIKGVVNKAPGLRPGMPFDEFARFLSESPSGRDTGANRHWMSQHRFITDDHGNLLADWLGKLETITRDFRELCRLLDLPELELPEKNPSAARGGKLGGDGPSARYREIYSAETSELIRDRYRRDIELFGYEY